MAYTSPSTAENQNESVKVKAKAPTIALAKMALALLFVISPPVNFFASIVIDQNKNKIVKLLDKADIRLIIYATKAVLPKANKLKKRPNN